MENNNVTKQEVLKFSAEMEEEASIKLAIAKVCDVNVTDIRIVMGGRDTISEKIKKKIAHVVAYKFQVQFYTNIGKVVRSQKSTESS
jgi:hypothetical protein